MCSAVSCRRSLWIWKPVQHRVRDEDCSVELRVVQGRVCLRQLLPDTLHRRVRMLRRLSHHHRDGHQPLPAQMGSAFRQRRLVHPHSPPKPTSTCPSRPSCRSSTGTPESCRSRTLGKVPFGCATTARVGRGGH
ncbi:hypothetical protein MUK42_02161 [Musa troglodytarum]|uniref:Uncharacterized protein n=1 Tax=Musa troglodytarum TaxID=320322 RepID=A0A9E7JIU9_9LILI|nr:hypothetical protein MUK42_02161 [Musa troglodytarum]